MAQKIGLASDHAGYELKEYVKSYLEEKGMAYKDYGTYSTESCDYPDYAAYPRRAKSPTSAPTPSKGARSSPAL